MADETRILQNAGLEQNNPSSVTGDSMLVNAGLDLGQGNAGNDLKQGNVDGDFFSTGEEDVTNEIDGDFFAVQKSVSKRKAMTYALADQHVNKDVLPISLTGDAPDPVPLSERTAQMMAKLESGDEDAIRLFFNEHSDTFRTVEFLKQFPMEASKLAFALDRIPPMDYAPEAYAIDELISMKYESSNPFDEEARLAEVEESFPEIIESVRDREIKNLRILNVIDELKAEAEATGTPLSIANWASIVLTFNITHRILGERAPKALAGQAMLDKREEWYGLNLDDGSFDAALNEWKAFVKEKGAVYINNPQLNALALETLYNMSDTEADFETAFNIVDFAPFITAPLYKAGSLIKARALSRKNTIDTLRKLENPVDVPMTVNRPASTDAVAASLKAGSDTEVVDLISATDHSLPSILQGVPVTSVGLHKDVDKTLEAQRYALGRLVTENNANVRLDADASKKLFDGWADAFAKRYDNSPADIRYLGREEATGLTRAEVIFGKVRGRGGYASERSAKASAERRKLTNFTTFQNEDGSWFIRQVHSLADQRKQPLIDLSTIKFSSPVANVLNPLGIVDFITRRRQIASAGRRDQMRNVLTREIFKPLADVSKKERQNVSDILAIGRQADRDLGDGVIKKGKWFTPEELDIKFKEQFDRLPTDKEQMAYYTYKNLSDFDYDIRNNDIYTKLASNGYIDVDIPNLYKGNAKPLQDFESIAARHYIYDPETGAKYRAGSLTPETIQQMRNDGYELFETTNDVARAGEDGNLPITHVITKSASKGPLSTQQLGYVEGGHVIYPDNNKFVKQANVGRTESGQPWIGNPLTHITGKDPKDVAAWATRWERARNAVLKSKAGKNNTQELTEALDDIDLDGIEDWNDLVHEGRIKEDTPFEVVDNGKQPSFLPESSSGYLDVRKEDGMLDDNTTYLVKQSRNKTFTGKRGEDLLQGPDDMAAEILDPWTAMDRAVNNAIRVNSLEPYRMQEVQRWVSTARANGVLDNAADEDIFRTFNNPVFNTKRQGTEELVGKLQLLKSNIQRQIGYQTAADKVVEASIDKLSSFVGKATKSGKVEASTHDFLDWARKNGPEELRRLASFRYLGAFNLRALWVQTQTAFVAASIAPTKAPQALAAYPMMRMYANASEEVLGNMSSIEKGYIKHITGMEGEEFTQMVRELQRSGLAAVDHGYSLLGDIAPSTNEVASKYAKTMRMGNSILVETEKFNTLNAWNIAWREYGEQFGTIRNTPEARLWLSDRTSALIQDMRASAKSMLQKEGSIPAQFFQYPAHITQNMLGGFGMNGSRFTKGESQRILLGQLALYGGGGFVGGEALVDYVDDAYYDIAGKPMDEGVYRALSSGILDYGMSKLFGIETDISSSAGSDLWKQLNQMFVDKTILEAMGGAAVPAGAGLAGGVIKAMKFMSTAVVGGDLTAEDIQSSLMDMAREISSVNNVDRAWRMYHTGVDISRSGRLQGMEKGTVDAVAALLNLPLQDSAQAWRAMKQTRNQSDRVSDTFKEINAVLERAEAEGTDEAIDTAAKRMHIWLSGLDPIEKGMVLQKVMKRNNTPLLMSIAISYNKKGQGSAVTDRKIMKENNKALTIQPSESEEE